MDRPLRVLIVEDSEDDTALLLRTLRRDGFAPEHERVDTAETMRAALNRQAWDAVLSDYAMPHFSAQAAQRLAREFDADVPFIIVSGTITEETAVEALRSGASDFLTKGNLARLGPAIERELEEARNRRERRRAEEALHRREQEFRALAENAPDIIARFDRDLRHVYVNRAVERVVGVMPQAFIGKTVREIGHSPEVEATWRAAIERVFETCGEQSIEYAYEGPRGRRHFQARLAPELAADGSVVSVMSIARDVTYQKLAEQALAASRAHIEDLYLRLQGAMTETHHRVKNNLQVIAAMIDMRLANDLDSIPAEDLRRLGHHVRALAVVHDILTQEAKRDGQAHYLPANEMLTKLLDLMQQSSGHRPIRVVIEDARVSARQGTSLALVLNELIGNAIKHGKGAIQVHFYRRDGHMQLVVADEGPGFPAEFDPARSASTGLELVNMLSRWDLGGEAIYENRAEGGARVRILIPARDEQV